MTWTDLTFTSSHVLTASDMNRLQGNFAALAVGDAGAPALAVNSFTVTGVASIATLYVSSGASIVGGGLPAGAVIPYAGTSAPAGWLLCDGAAVSRSVYATLFAVIGTVFGAGDGSTTFNVPDLRGRAVVALDNLGGSSADRLTGTWADSLGGAGGEETHTLTVSEMPAHTHSIRQFWATFNRANGAATAGYDGTFNATGSAGGDGAHNNVQPAMALGYVIKT